MNMKMMIGDTEVEVEWADNKAVADLKKITQSGKLTIPMSMYGGVEQVGPIGQSLSRDDRQMSTTSGDIVLYSGNQLVVFYESHSWSYTPLGKIKNQSDEELSALLSSGNVTITIE